MPMEQPAAVPAQAANGQQDPMQAIQVLGESLSGLMDALSQSGAPKEVLAPLQASIQAYGEFVNTLQGKGQQPIGNADMNQAQGSTPANY